MQYLDAISKMTEWSLFISKANHSVSYYYDTEVYAPTSNAKEAEVERFYEDLQDLLELTSPKNVLFIIGDWNEKGGSQEIPGVKDNFGLGIQNEAGQRQSFLFTGHSIQPLATTQEKKLHRHH